MNESTHRSENYCGFYPKINLVTSSPKQKSINEHDVWHLGCVLWPSNKV